MNETNELMVLRRLADAVRRCKTARSVYRATSKDANLDRWHKAEDKMFSALDEYDVLRRRETP